MSFQRKQILKYRPFRGASLFTLLVLIAIVLYTKPKLTSNKTLVSNLFITILAVLFTYGIGRNINEKYINVYFLQDEKKTAWKDMTSFAKNQTEKGSIFFIQGVRESIRWTFSRNSDRDVFVLKKFVPIDKNKWNEWYQRLQVQVENVEQMAALKKNYQLDYYLSTPSRPKIGEVVFENSHYIISRLRDSE